jgi:hypothetical protein
VPPTSISTTMSNVVISPNERLPRSRSRINRPR